MVHSSISAGIEGIGGESDFGPTDSASVMPFACKTSYADERAVVVVIGEIDLASAPTLLRTIRATLALPVRGLVLDLGGVEFMDSSGIHALLTTRREAAERGVPVALASIGRQPRSVLDVTGVTGLFEMPPPPEDPA